MRKCFLIVAALAAPLAAQEAPALFDSTRTVPLSPGHWSYIPTATGSEARFGTIFSIRCDRASRRVTLRRTDPVAATPAAAMTIGTDLAVRTLPVDGVVTNVDPVLDAIAFSRGRFIVSGGGMRLVLPASPEAARSIDHCRN